MSIIMKSLIIAAVIFAAMNVVAFIAYLRVYIHLYNSLSEDEYKEFCSLPWKTQNEIILGSYNNKETL